MTLGLGLSCLVLGAWVLGAWVLWGRGSTWSGGDSFEVVVSGSVVSGSTGCLLSFAGFGSSLGGSGVLTGRRWGGIRCSGMSSKLRPEEGGGEGCEEGGGGGGGIGIGSDEPIGLFLLSWSIHVGELDRWRRGHNAGNVDLAHIDCVWRTKLAMERGLGATGAA